MDRAFYALVLIEEVLNQYIRRLGPLQLEGRQDLPHLSIAAAWQHPEQLLARERSHSQDGAAYAGRGCHFMLDIQGCDQFIKRDVPKGTESLDGLDRKSTRLNSSHSQISYAVFCLKKNT